MSDSSNPKPTDIPDPAKNPVNPATTLPTSAARIGYDSAETESYQAGTTSPEQASIVNTTHDAARDALRGAMNHERGAARDAQSQTDATPANQKPKEEAAPGAASNTNPLANG